MPEFATISWRWLMARRSIGIPNAALAGGRKMARGYVGLVVSSSAMLPIVFVAPLVTITMLTAILGVALSIIGTLVPISVMPVVAFVLPFVGRAASALVLILICERQ
jgi:hypothetical protein